MVEGMDDRITCEHDWSRLGAYLNLTQVHGAFDDVRIVKQLEALPIDREKEGIWVEAIGTAHRKMKGTNA